MADAQLNHAEKTIKTTQAAVFTALDDGTSMLMNLDSKYYFQLNPTGTRMWEYIEKHKKLKVQSLYEAMCEIYDIDNGIIAKDINGFLSNLLQEKMVELI